MTNRSLGIDAGSLGWRFALSGEDRLPVWVPQQLQLQLDSAAGEGPWKWRLGRTAPRTLDTAVEQVLRAGRFAAGQVAENPVDRVAVTVPAAFPLRGRQILYEAAGHAGFADVFLVSDSVAAAAERSRQVDEGHLLIFLCGYSGFEVSVISLLGGRFQVLGYGGGRELCGRELDRRLFRQAATRAFLAPETIERLSCHDHAVQQFVLHLRDRLAREDEVELRFELPGGERFDGQLAAGDCEQVVGPQMEIGLSEINRVLGEARLRASDLSEVVLAGGPTAATPFTSILERHLSKPVHRLHDWSAAFGAARLAATLRESVPAAPLGLTLYDSSQAEVRPAGRATEPIRFVLLERPDEPAAPASAPSPASPAAPEPEPRSQPQASPISETLSRKLAFHSIEKARVAIAEQRLQEAVNLSHQAHKDFSGTDVFEAMIEIHCQAAAANNTPEGYPKSIEWLACASSHNKGNPKIRRALADRHLLHAQQQAQRGKREDAVTAAEAAYQIRPDSSEIEQLLRELRQDSRDG